MTTDEPDPSEPDGSTVTDAESVVEPAGTDETTATRDTVLTRPADQEVDDAELVGPGRFPLRIQPSAAIAPGTKDAKRLLTIWFVRKSFYWLFFTGLAIGWTVTVVRDDQDVDVGVDWLHPSTLLTPWLPMILALGLRFVVGWIALALAAPLVFAHEPNLSPRENFGSSIGVFFDRLNLARGFRAFRWTHHVRQVALRRLGPTGDRVGKLDPTLDVVNIVSGVLAFLIPITASVVTNAGG
jgi:hypothetical protein